ncbi:MAG: leucine-rich repeat domain-containing protein, partial [Oscillospiraceae bacterium]
NIILPNPLKAAPRGNLEFGGFLFDQSTQTITGYTTDVNATKKIVIPEEINGVKVLHIADNAFSGRQITSLNLPEGLLTIGARAFSYNKELAGSVNFPNSLISVGMQAFDSCEALQSVSFGSNIAEIPTKMFAFCTSLETANLQDGIIKINKDAFSQCSSLTNINFPNTLTSIADSAFSNTALTSVNIPQSVTSFGGNVFAMCKNIASVVLPDNLTSIPFGMFQGNTSLKSVAIPNGVKTIEDYAFSKSGLTTIVIPENVNRIGRSAFSETELTSVIIPNSVAEIGYNAFEKCPNLKKIEIPTKVKNSINGAPWGSSTMILWKDMFDKSPFVFDAKTNNIVAYNGKESDIVIPDSFLINGKSVAVIGIGESTFENCTNILTVTLPNSLEIIGKKAFKQCNNLKSISLPSNVTSVGEDAFARCNNLETINILHKNRDEIIGAPWGSDGLINWKNFAEKDFFVIDTINKSIVKYKGNSGNVIIPEIFDINGEKISVTSIEEYAFKNIGAKTVTIPQSITSISERAFFNCGQLKRINIPSKESGSIIGEPWGANNAAICWKNIEEINEYLFNSSTNTIIKYIGVGTKLDVPSSFNINGADVQVSAIGEKAFTDCDTVVSITLPNTLIAIGDMAFSHCNALVSVIIPNSVTTLGISAFEFCSNLTSVTLSNQMTAISDMTFKYCRELESISFPSNIISIGKNVFEKCETIKTVVLPNSVTTAGDNAFYGCSGLESVTISTSLKDISNGMFRDCKSLKSVIIPENINN